MFILMGLGVSESVRFSGDEIALVIHPFSYLGYFLRSKGSKDILTSHLKIRTQENILNTVVRLKIRGLNIKVGLPVRSWGIISVLFT